MKKRGEDEEMIGGILIWGLVGLVFWGMVALTKCL